jgi:hypothetical protein
MSSDILIYFEQKERATLALVPPLLSAVVATTPLRRLHV